MLKYANFFKLWKRLSQKSCIKTDLLYLFRGYTYLYFIKQFNKEPKNKNNSKNQKIPNFKYVDNKSQGKLNPYIKKYLKSIYH